MDSKQLAQQRCDQIAAFNSELETLEGEGVELPEASKQAIQQHHAVLIEHLTQSFDIDATETDKQLSTGMKLASFAGALAFAASIFFLFYQYWGYIDTWLQTAILVASPLVMLGVTAVFHHREQSGYFAKIGALITLACFVLNLSMLGQIYNITPSPNAFIVWLLLSLGLAYKTRSRLMLAFAIMLASAFLSARMGTWFGMYWISFGERPENFFLPALLIFALGHIKQKHYESFGSIYRVFGMLLLMMPVLILAHWAGVSYFDYPREMVEGVYQILGFALSAGFVWYGIRRNWSDTVNTATVFFTLFLYTKFFDWWWDWFPKYLFFLVIALSSLLILMIFKRLRVGMKASSNNPAQQQVEVNSQGESRV